MGLFAGNADLGNERFSHDHIASTLSPRFQQLIILPTEKCNFRCTYCYEDFVIGRMREPVQAAIERYMDRRVPGLRELSISWFGGEPLVAKAVVLRLSSYAHQLCRQHGVNLSGGLTTNSYLLDFQLFEELLSYDQRFFQITLDGWNDGHNAVRKLANGKGTFDRIWGNLLATRDSKECFAIQIRIHVRRDNYSSLETLVDHIAAEFGGDSRYTLDYEHLRNLGGEGGMTVDRPLSLAELKELEVGLRARFDATVGATSKRGIPTSLGSAPAIDELAKNGSPEAVPYICYASKPNSLLIRADGRIGKCTVALNDDRNTIGKINEDGTLTIDNAKLQPWVRGLSTLEEKALECPLSGMART